jgi:voltage-gated potassium channel
MATLEEQYVLEIKREKERVKRKMLYALALLGIVYVSAIIAFHLTEGWDWLDSVYFTTSTITTVGYGDLVPHTQFGRMFTIPLMLIGIGVGFYVIYALQDYGRHQVEPMVKQVETNIRNRRERP